MKPPPVLVVGAGPTGLFLAYALKRQDVDVRIIDQKPGPSAQSRAMGVQARTLEFYRQFGLADKAIALGVPTGDVHFAVEGKERFTFSLIEMGQGQSRYPFLHTLAQDVHERFLVEELGALGVSVDWNTALAGIKQSEEAVTATLSKTDGTSETIKTDWLIGCDGASSATRHALGIGFSGGTTEGLFYVADVETSVADADIHAGIGRDTMSILMPVGTTKAKRMIGIISDDVATKEPITFEDVSDTAIRLLGLSVSKVNWFSTYRTHHRVADRFRLGRCFLAGDAGHIHSPVGGQGMNTGLGDAMNLSWKLAHVIQGRAAASLLDSYEPERIAFAKSLIATTDTAFNRLVSESRTAQIVRRYIAPRIVWLLTRFAAPKRMIFKIVSQIRIAYRTSPLSEGDIGTIKGGDRLPYVAEMDNHGPLNALDWQLHIYGQPSPPLAAAAAKIGLSVKVFPMSNAARAAGLRPEAAYLARPDGHVGIVLPQQQIEALSDYVARHELVFAHGASSA